jgi:hypothetical protein
VRDYVCCVPRAGGGVLGGAHAINVPAITTAPLAPPHRPFCHVRLAPPPVLRCQGLHGPEQGYALRPGHDRPLGSWHAWPPRGNERGERGCRSMRSSKAIEAEGSMGMARASGLHELLTAGGRQDGDGASAYGACEPACLRTGGGHAPEVGA